MVLASLRDQGDLGWVEGRGFRVGMGVVYFTLMSKCFDLWYSIRVDMVRFLGVGTFDQENISVLSGSFW